MAKSTVSEAEAWSVKGATGGWADFSTAAEGEFNLTSLEGKYVKISAISQGFLVCFFAAAGGTIGTLDATSETAGIPELVPANAKDHVIVPKGFPFLRYKPASGTGTITVVRG